MTKASDLVNDISSTYDNLPYVSKSFTQTHPCFLKAVCSLFNFETPDAETANILEIGCAFGGNIIPVAQNFPKANIIGLDISEKQISAGQDAIKTMGLKNIKLKQQDITTYKVPKKKFDYIICHGVYSWVPEVVREAILQVIADGLSDNGVAFVSYNTYPGWKITEVYRDSMLYRSQPVDDIREKVKYGFGMLDFLKENLPKQSPWGVAIDQHYDYIRQADISYLAHEYFEVINEPCYFHQFMGLAQEKGLNFVAEADFQNHFYAPIPLDDEAYQALKRESGGDPIKLEQLSDFLSNRKFRQTLLTRSSVQQTVDLDGKKVLHEALEKLYIQGNFFQEKDNNSKNLQWKSVETPNGIAFKSVPETDFIFEKLNRLNGKTIKIEVLWNMAKSSDQKFDRTAFFNTIAEIILRRVVKIRSSAVSWEIKDKSKPQILKTTQKLLQWLKENPNTISLSTIFHNPIQLNVIADELMPMLDGKHSIDDLHQQLIEATNAKRVIFYDNNKAEISDPDKIANAAAEHTEKLLNLLSYNGLLV